MPCSKQFVEEYGKLSFTDYPFCDADALTLCEVFYMPLELVVSNSVKSQPVDFSDACYKLFEMRGNKHKPLGLMITSNPSKRIMQMTDYLRYREMKIACVHAVYSVSPAIQYCAGAFLLPDGKIVIVFRGTDDTIAGWKEDLDIFTRKGTPSYDLAMDFINSVAAEYEGEIILCGHSKGGNIALRTACKCSDEIRSRIVNVYNFDGPGYADASIFYTPAYKEVLPGYRHFVPSSSLIGMMMSHDYDYKAVKSNVLFGAFQHDLHTWQIAEGELILVDDVDFLAKLTDEWLGVLIQRLSDVSSGALDIVATAITEGTGTKSLTDLAKHAYTAVGGAVKAYKAVDDETKSEFKDAFRGGGKLLIGAFKAVRENTTIAATIVSDAVSRKLAESLS